MLWVSVWYIVLWLVELSDALPRCSDHCFQQKTVETRINNIYLTDFLKTWLQNFMHSIWLIFQIHIGINEPLHSCILWLNFLLTQWQQLVKRTVASSVESFLAHVSIIYLFIIIIIIIIIISYYLSLSTSPVLWLNLSTVQLARLISVMLSKRHH